MSQLNSSGVYRLVDQITGSANQFFKTKKGQVLESVVCALGFRNEAAFIAHVKGNPDWRSTEFDHSKFVTRLSQLVEHDDTATAVATAEAVGVLAQGVTIEFDIQKWSASRLRTSGSIDPVYDVSVVARGVSAQVLEGKPEFFLPQFFNHGRELFRLDSASWLRVDPYPLEVTRDGLSRRGLLSAMLDAGKWQGGLYVYEPVHQQDDQRCLRSVKAAMVRAILPALTAGVRCRVFKPDRYSPDAWRAELSIGPAAKAFMGGDFSFEFPDPPKRLVTNDAGFGTGPGPRRIVEGIWRGDIYPNGVNEGDISTDIYTVRARLISAVYARLAEAGWRFTAPEIPENWGQSALLTV